MDDVLKALSAGGYVSGEALSQALGITRAAVWKRIEALRQAGYVIESGGKRGYRLIPPADGVDPLFWQGALTTRWAGRPECLYAWEMTSTNTVLKEAVAQGAARGTVALCESQTSGKGRLGRSWFSPPGQGLWLSVLARPRLAPGDAALLTLASALAMAQAVEEAGFAPRIKWPNDLVLEGKKICGILLEMAADQDRLDYVVIGTGLNTGPGSYPAELQGKAWSLGEAAGRPVPRVPVLLAYLKHLEAAVERLETAGLAGIRADYECRSCTLGKRVQVTGGTVCQGIAQGMDETGALLVREDNGRVCRVLAGDVSVRGVMGYAL